MLIPSTTDGRRWKDTNLAAQMSPQRLQAALLAHTSNHFTPKKKTSGSTCLAFLDSANPDDRAEIVRHLNNKSVAIKALLRTPQFLTYMVKSTGYTLASLTKAVLTTYGALAYETVTEQVVQQYRQLIAQPELQDAKVEDPSFQILGQLTSYMKKIDGTSTEASQFIGSVLAQIETAQAQDDFKPDALHLTENEDGTQLLFWYGNDQNQALTFTYAALERQEAKLTRAEQETAMDLTQSDLLHLENTFDQDDSYETSDEEPEALAQTPPPVPSSNDSDDNEPVLEPALPPEDHKVAGNSFFARGDLTAEMRVPELKKPNPVLPASEAKDGDLKAVVVEAPPIVVDDSKAKLKAVVIEPILPLDKDSDSSAEDEERETLLDPSGTETPAQHISKLSQLSDLDQYQPPRPGTNSPILAIISLVLLIVGIANLPQIALLHITLIFGKALIDSVVLIGLGTLGTIGSIVTACSGGQGADDYLKVPSAGGNPYDSRHYTTGDPVGMFLGRNEISLIDEEKEEEKRLLCDV